MNTATPTYDEDALESFEAPVDDAQHNLVMRRGIRRQLVSVISIVLFSLIMTVSVLEDVIAKIVGPAFFGADTGIFDEISQAVNAGEIVAAALMLVGFWFVVKLSGNAGQIWSIFRAAPDKPVDGLVEGVSVGPTTVSFGTDWVRFDMEHVKETYHLRAYKRVTLFSHLALLPRSDLLMQFFSLDASPSEMGWLPPSPNGIAMCQRCGRTRPR